ncbi:MAG: FecR domain-containing protein [Oligoflexia bacterium]|nr:FecR domain-containing protein [Oligoflexia bacterium]
MGKFTLSIILFSLLSLQVFANKGVAKVIILKGKAEAEIDGKKTPLKKGMWLPEGVTVETQPKSFTKLLFVDKSSMNVGPKSQMKISAFPKKEAGIITLMKGQIRSKVTKNYMDIKDKSKSKLFIKTKTAAMGVRGTDFQVNFNPINNATSLVTFEGAVAMARFDNLARSAASAGRFNQRALERVVSSESAVMVRKGQYSGASPKMERVTVPVKISPIQLETLKNNEAASLNKGSSGPKKTFRSVLPPGVDGKSFANDGKEMEKEMASNLGKGAMKEIKKEIVKEMALAGPSVGAEGMIDQNTGAIAPTAGGFVDLGTAQYIPPPPGSAYDPVADVYIPPPNVGRIDFETGDFVNDHYELTPEGEFIAKDNAGGPEGRGPADAGAPPPPPPPPLEPSGLPLGLGPNNNPDSPNLGPDASPICIPCIVERKIKEAKRKLEEEQNKRLEDTNTRVNFEITID